MRLRESTDLLPKFVFFVGSFAANDWMFSKLQNYFQSLGVSFSRPDNHW
jgi:hypothetical protein